MRILKKKKEDKITILPLIKQIIFWGKNQQKQKTKMCIWDPSTINFATTFPYTLVDSKAPWYNVYYWKIMVNKGKVTEN